MYGEGKIRVGVVIAAAGKGTRMGMEQSKQYVDVLGKPVLAWTLQAFEKSGLTDEIIIVTNESEIEYCKSQIIDRYGFVKVIAVVAGGASRQKSVYNGLKRLGPDCGIVLIHDGARPFIDEGTITACIEEAAQYGAAITAVPVKDTIKRGDEDGFVCETMDRSCLWSVQTPQAFRYRLILDAHKKAAADGFDGTDDAILAERLGNKVRLVMGTYFNIKITTREDLTIAGAIAGMER